MDPRPRDRARDRWAGRLLLPLAADEARARFWVGHVRVGVALSEAAAIIVLGYVVLADRPHRTAFVGLAALIIVASPLLLLLPIQRLSLTTRGPLLFYLWSMAVTVVVAVVALVDGGAESPTLWLLILTMAFAALAYPPLGVLVMGALMAAVYVVVAAIDAAVGADTFLVAAILLAFTVMTAWVSRNQWETYHQQVLLSARLAELDRAREEFVATTSHELRTPVTSILGYVELLEQAQQDAAADQQGADTSRFLPPIRRNAERLRHLSEDLLVLSRWDTENRVGSGEGEPVGDADLVEVVGRVCETMSPLAAQQGIVLTCEVPEEPMLVTGSADQLERALLNLVSNAVKYTPAGGSVTGTVRRDGDEAVVEVRDTGIGIADDEVEQLFARFFRASSARERAISGVGLGLSIVHEIVTAHGGHIDVTSTLGEGTNFVVRLPCLPPVATPAVEGGSARVTAGG